MANRIRPMMGVSIDPDIKDAIDAAAKRHGLNRGQMVEALLAPGLEQIRGGDYDVVWSGKRFTICQRVRG